MQTVGVLSGVGHIVSVEPLVGEEQAFVAASALAFVVPSFALVASATIVVVGGLLRASGHGVVAASSVLKICHTFFWPFSGEECNEKKD